MASNAEMTVKTMWLDGEDFNAQRYAHSLLLRVSKPTDPTVLRGVRAPNKQAAHLALTLDADAIGMSLRADRVQLVRRWIDMSSGVRI